MAVSITATHPITLPDGTLYRDTVHLKNVIDHPRMLHAADGVKITLDKIDAHALSDPGVMRADLSKRLGVEVMSYQITALDYINDMARINVFYRKR